MPPIRFLNRNLLVASDDFVHNILVENILRFLWFLILLVTFILKSDSLTDDKCDHKQKLKHYYIVMFSIQLFIVCYNFNLMKESMKGAIIDSSNERALVPMLLLGKVIMLIPEGVFIASGSYLLNSANLNGCSADIIKILRTILIFCFIIYLFLLLSVFVAFDPAGCTFKHESFAASVSIWMKRCKIFFCVLPCIEPDNLNFVAQIMADFFYKSNFVFSDFLAGLILLNNEQKLHREKTKKFLVPYKGPFEEQDTSTELRDSSSSSYSFEYKKPLCDWMTLENSLYFFKFAAACYGNCCRIVACCCYNTFCPCYKAERCVRPNGVMHGDCCMSCFIIKKTAVNREDFLYTDFENRNFESPFYVVLDHKTSSIVLSIRGTLSITDIVTDLTVEVKDMELGLFKNELAHVGMLKTAMSIQQTLIREGIIEKALVKYPEYRLVLTGHSLGAGVASLLAIILKKSFPPLICFAYSTPGWIVSYPVCVYAENFILSVVVGQDIVPRLTVSGMRSLKYHTMILVQNCNLAKYQVFNRVLTTNCIFRYFFYRSLTLSDNSRRFVLEEVRDKKNKKSKHSHFSESPFKRAESLRIPGKILQLERISNEENGCRKSTYKAYWAHRKLFEEILVSKSMLIDHTLGIVANALESAIKSKEEEEIC